MKHLSFPVLALTLLCAAKSQVSTAQAQGTAFTYQGQLGAAGSPATGTYDFRFSIYNAVTNGTRISGPLTNAATGVTGGIFTVVLDFGNQFPGSARWLEIGVRTNDSGSFNTLTPRQALTPAPYAVFANTASNVNGTVPATQISGAVPSANLSGTYDNAVTFNNASDSFTGNGGGLTNLNASRLSIGTVADALLSGNVALLNANQTFTGVNTFAGANQGLIVNGGPVGTNLFTGLGLQYNPGSGEAAIISSLNDDRSFLTFYTKLGAGCPAVQQMKIDRNGVVMIDQQANNNGVLNDGTTNGVGLVLGANSGEGIASQRTPGINQFGLDFYTSRTRQMSILSNGNVGMGTTNPSTALQVSGTVTAAAFSGDGSALINLDASQLNGGTIPNSVLSGFQGNYSTVGGGNGNTAGDNEATVGGGLNNTASGQESTVGGGNTNQATGQYSTVPGGANNLASGKWSFAAGRRAQATNQAAFVWADSQNAPFASTNKDSFNVRAEGGVNFATSGTGIAVDGQPVLTGANLSGVQGTAVWQVTSGISVQAQPNTGYLLTNSKQVTVTLPTSPNVGDVLEVFDSGSGGWGIAQNESQSILHGYAASPGTWLETSSPSLEWSCIASSSDGTKLAAAVGNNPTGGGIYTSINSGATWHLTSAINQQWSGIASSSDGTKLVAVSYQLPSYTGSIYTSTNSGATWSLSATNNNPFTCVASSSDGRHLATAGAGGVFVSSDAGATWSLTSVVGAASIASSSDGSTLAAVAGGGILVSTSFGTNWRLSNATTTHLWTSIACSSDGQHLAAVAWNDSQDYYNSAIYISSDAGVTWSQANVSTNASWSGIASSADGRYLSAVADAYWPDSGIYSSTDFGATWNLMTAGATNYWASIASSSDGTKLAATVGFPPANGPAPSGKIWTSRSVNTPWTTTTGSFGILGGPAGSGVKLVYAGGGQFVLVNQQGSIYGL